jgi:hypothetical protein
VEIRQAPASLAEGNDLLYALLLSGAAVERDLPQRVSLLVLALWAARNGDLDLQMNWILNIVFRMDTGEEVLEHLRRRFPGEMFFTSEPTPGTVYIVHVTEKANQEVINETYRIADLIYERNEKEKENLRLLPAVAAVDRPLLRLWEPEKKHESQAEVSECIDPLS